MDSTNDVDHGAAGIGSCNEHGIRQICWNSRLAEIVVTPCNNASIGPNRDCMSESRRDSQELSGRRDVDIAEFLQRAIGPDCDYESLSCSELEIVLS
jgi:hypothetical protein